MCWVQGRGFTSVFFLTVMMLLSVKLSIIPLAWSVKGPVVKNVKFTFLILIIIKQLWVLY